MKKKLNILFQHDNPHYEERINYVLDFINNHPLADEKVKIITNPKSKEYNLDVFYGVPKGKYDFKIPAQKVFFSNSKPNFDQLIANLFAFDKQILYSVEKQNRKRQVFLKGNIFQFDLIETIFFHISRFEEWHYQEDREDEHGRMASEHLFLVKNQLHREPIVDQLIICFLRALGIEIEDKETSYRVTHDIDLIFKKNDFFGIAKSIGGFILKRQDFLAAWQIWKNRYEENPYDTFNWMLRKEEDVEKVIYFLVGGQSKFDNPYNLQIPVFRKAVQLSKDKGYQFGIHPSYHTWKDEFLMQEEREKLQNAIGEGIILTRQHFLRFSFKDTPQIIQRLGFKEDSSLGYADRIGFRCGTGFAYRLYDYENEKPFDFMENPLVVMDSALITEANNRPDQVRKIWEAFISKNHINTKITFNFHNSRFYDAQIQNIPLRALYESLFSFENS